MYAKLVVGGTNLNSQRCIRDIVRLLISNNPNIANLYAYSTLGSVVVDATPAGWTYVGSADPADVPTLTIRGAGFTAGNNQTNAINYVVSAPGLYGTGYKYAALTCGGANTGNSFIAFLTGATGAIANGVMTNEGPRYLANSMLSGTDLNLKNAGFACGLANSIHVVANPRHITIIEEGVGMHALWESSYTDPHYYYGNVVPVVQYSHANSANYIQDYRTTPLNVTDTAVRSNTIMTAVFGLTDPNTGSTYGTYDPTQFGAQNGFYLTQIANTVARNNSISNTGIARYNLTTAFYTIPQIGYPTSFITGTVPVYWTKGNIGSTGDTAVVNGVTYTLFNCGSGFSVLMTTGN
jgi:hypothetical protein